PVTNYVVERADGGCGGTFAGIASTTAGADTDTAVSGGATYGYRIRTCPFQGSNCVAATVPSGTPHTPAGGSPSAKPSVLSQPVTFTATVTVNPPGSGVPTGTVTFKDGAATLGTGTLDGTGHATFTTSALTVASHSITAVYGGDPSFSGSTSSAITQTVNKD